MVLQKVAFPWTGATCSVQYTLPLQQPSQRIDCTAAWRCKASASRRSLSSSGRQNADQCRLRSCLVTASFFRHGHGCSCCTRHRQDRTSLFRDSAMEPGSSTASFHFARPKPWPCYICDKNFRYRVDLKTHLRTHTGEKPFECPECDMRFIQHNQLTTHLRTHTGMKPHECSYCQKKFSHGSDLQKHIRIHTGLRPYECKTCGKAFTQSGSLQTHLRIHSGEKPYKCVVCEKAFRDRSNLRAHHRSYHTLGEAYELITLE